MQTHQGSGILIKCHDIKIGMRFLASDDFADFSCHNSRGYSGTAKVPTPIAGFAAHQVAGAGSLISYLPAAPNLHPFSYAFVCF